MSSSSKPVAGKKPSFFGKIKRLIKRPFKHPLKRKRRIRRFAKNPELRSELMGPRRLPIGYYNMPKAGCSTIKNILFYLEKDRWLENPLDIHLAVSRGNGLLLYENFQRQRLKLEQEKPYFVFTFVRHPGRRVFSAFIEKILCQSRYSMPELTRHLLATSVFTHRGQRITTIEELPPLEQIQLEDLRHNFKAFLRFVRYNLNQQTKFIPNPHWMSQALRLDSMHGNEKIDFIGRVENFVEDFEHVLRQVGIDKPELAKMRFNEGPKPPFRYEDVLDSNIRAHIRKIYAEDFKRFGYQED
jgi:Sulfotransferase family